VIPFAAVNVSVKTPFEVAVPLSVPVPFPLSVKPTPAGNVPDSVTAGVGTPTAVTVKEPGAFKGKLLLLALVIVGAKLVGTDVVVSATVVFVSTFPTRSLATL